MAEPQRIPQPRLRGRVQPAPRLEPAAPERSEPRPSTPRSTPDESRMRGVLLTGLGLTAAVLIAQGRTLPTADILLGAATLVAGASLLVVLDLCRR